MNNAHATTGQQPQSAVKGKPTVADEPSASEPTSLSPSDVANVEENSAPNAVVGAAAPTAAGADLAAPLTQFLNAAASDDPASSPEFNSPHAYSTPISSSPTETGLPAPQGPSSQFTAPFSAQNPIAADKVLLPSKSKDASPAMSLSPEEYDTPNSTVSLDLPDDDVGREKSESPTPTDDRAALQPGAGTAAMTTSGFERITVGGRTYVCPVPRVDSEDFDHNENAQLVRERDSDYESPPHFMTVPTPTPSPEKFWRTCDERCSCNFCCFIVPFFTHRSR